VARYSGDCRGGGEALPPGRPTRSGSRVSGSAVEATWRWLAIGLSCDRTTIGEAGPALITAQS
jgi:hypothetical protein